MKPHADQQIGSHICNALGEWGVLVATGDTLSGKEFISVMEMDSGMYMYTVYITPGLTDGAGTVRVFKDGISYFWFPTEAEPYGVISGEAPALLGAAAAAADFICELRKTLREATKKETVEVIKTGKIKPRTFVRRAAQTFSRMLRRGSLKVKKRVPRPDVKVAASPKNRRRKR